MASIVLSGLAATAGSFAGGAFGTAAGRLLGAFAGSIIDNKLFANTVRSSSNGPRLKDLSIQTAAYGLSIPIIFGTVRTSGNIIWARPLKETPTMQRYSGRTKGSKVIHDRTEYEYHASFAVSICEGAIDEVVRIYAGQEQIQPSLYNIRIYKGCEMQMPDPMIESFEGVGKTPAFRGQAYAVFEDFPLAEFGNYLPNFNFEVRKRTSSSFEQTAEDLIKSVIIIPGGGEYVYDTVAQYKSIGSEVAGIWCPLGMPKNLNQSTNSTKTNAIVAIDQLQKTLPKVEWVAVVVNWFSTSLNIKDCKIMPGVEYSDDSTRTHPDPWSVYQYSRNNAHQISVTNCQPNYGGTINDSSLIRFIDELKSRGLKVMIYPMVFMDLPDKPWRGKISGDAIYVNEFFKSIKGYNNFITHYCELLKGKVDALVIGSEFKSLTSIQAEDNSFPAVAHLVDLARTCREIVGKNTIITYAADWSEYHHTENGWYHLDALWASDDIDVIGIDSYFPLSNSQHSVYNIDEIIRGWDKGEGYTFYYTDTARTQTKPLNPEHAWKNIRWWWENYHINPDGLPTMWKPRSKKIWFTEYGFPSVDCCTNQPNVFYDPKARIANFPIHSKGIVDFKAQRNAIIATELKWQNSDMVEQKFLWCWDARPYPYWPDLSNMWSDGGCWQKGHWVQGKIGHSTLAGVIEDLSYRTGLTDKHIACSEIQDTIDGLVIDSQSPAKSIIEILQKAYKFDTVEKDGRIHFSPPTKKDPIEIASCEIAKVDDKPIISLSRTQEIELPQKLDINYIDIGRNYQISNQHSLWSSAKSMEKISIDLPLAMSQSSARLIAENCIHDLWASRNNYSFYLTQKYLNLVPGDIIKIVPSIDLPIKIVSMRIGKNNLIKIEGTSYKPFKKTIGYGDEAIYKVSEFIPISPTRLEILDIPLFAHDESCILVGACASTENWNGTTLFASSIKGSSYNEYAYIDTLATTGHAITKLPPHNTSLIDYKSRVIVNIEHGELISVSMNDIANGSNLSKIGNELLQFQKAKLIAKHQYELSILYRGRYSTEDAIYSHKEGDRFILIDEHLKKLEIPISSIGQTKYIKAISYGQTLGQTKEIEFIYQGNCLKAFSPVGIHISSNQEVSWMRRNRILTDFRDYTDIPNEMTHERYLVQLLDPNNNVIETVHTTERSLKVEQSCRSIRICQLNNLGMEGYYAQIKIK